MSLLAENNRGACALRQSVEKYNKSSFKRCETHQMFSGVLSCSDTKSYTQICNWIYNLLHKTVKQWLYIRV